MSPGDETRRPRDPFWDVVRRRHPDVDIVLLPPEPPSAPSAEPASPALARRVARDVDEQFEQVWERLLGSPDATTTTVRWEAGTTSGSGAPVRSGRIEDLEPDAARAVVTRAEADLTARAWRVTPPSGSFHRVSASSGGTTVTVSSHGATCRVEVRGPELLVGRDGLRDLRREASA